MGERLYSDSDLSVVVRLYPDPDLDRPLLIVAVGAGGSGVGGGAEAETADLAFLVDPEFNISYGGSGSDGRRAL